ncbi:hypothetical protein LPJ61_003245 [Coemansia biformis]|uniref:protein-histidine N-methyltransferase n=1 Tax=Coemansia biformis TaxID=1286918 RepID=A0A9W8CYT5_9FUNG|nr:hypothetical protein LPJ61_003245 [Coemansia biformis]
MSFRFNFGLGVDGECVAGVPDADAAGLGEEPAYESSSAASYERVPLSIPRVSSIVVDAIYYKDRRLWKRQLDDVRFQLAQQDAMDGSARGAVQQAMATDGGAADVVKGVYEGGLKTWECSMDLLGYLVEHGDDIFAPTASPRVLELGCGTGLPSLHVLTSAPGASVCMQDYNRDVLELITIPNILANTVIAPGGCAAGDTTHASDGTETCEIDIDFRRTGALFGANVDEAIGQRELPELSGEEALEADARILQALDASGRCECVAGDWASVEEEMHRQGRAHTFDVIMTSETIYDTASYPRLHSLLACLLAKPGPCQSPLPTVLVAAKTVYFGLTGSVLSFKQYVQASGVFDIETVWESGGSMGREILRMTWRASGCA